MFKYKKLEKMNAKKGFSKAQLASQKVSKENAAKAEDIRLEAIKKGKVDKFDALSNMSFAIVEMQAKFETYLVEFAEELGIEFVDDVSDDGDFLNEMKESLKESIILEVKESIVLDVIKAVSMDIKKAVELEVKDALTLEGKKCVDVDKSKKKSVDGGKKKK